MKRRWRDLYEKLYVKRSAIVGRGLYTPVAIAKGAKIGEFEGEVIGLREARRRARGRRIVAIVELDRHAIDAGNPVYPGAWTAPDGSSYPPSIFGMKNTSAPGGTN